MNFHFSTLALRMLCTGLLLFVSTFVNAQERLAVCADKLLTPLISLAKLRNYYVEEGVDVELRHIPSGRLGLEAMFKGECQLASAAEPPVVHFSLLRKDFFILAMMSTSDNWDRLIVRSDRGIARVADLRGRSIAVPKYTVAHYFLDMYLVANGLTPQDVKQVFLPVSEVITSFKNGEVDAAVYWEPEIQRLSDQLGPKVRVITAPGLHVIPFMLLGEKDYVHNHPDTVKRVLRALVRAEQFAKQEPDNAKALLGKAFSNTLAEVNVFWSLIDKRISMDQSLPFILENVARWEIGLMLPSQQPMIPNYLDFIYFDAMTAVKPGATTIIH